jgi:hypothetical protein
MNLGTTFVDTTFVASPFCMLTDEHLKEEEVKMPTRATKTRSKGTWSAGAKRRSTKKSAQTTSAKKSTKTTTTRPAAHRSSHGKRKWSAGVDTESTYPQEGLFKKDAATIAKSLASTKVSPKGPSSGMRMLTFYVNRAGKNLSKSRLRVLEHAKELLHQRIEKTRIEKTKKSGRGRAARRSH